MALVFGRTYPARELLRAWSTGTFSRLDAALLLIWLTCAIFRIGVLCTTIRMLGQEYAIQKRKEVRQGSSGGPEFCFMRCLSVGACCSCAVRPLKKV